MAEKKNPDYTQSAWKLTNSEVVAGLMLELRQVQAQIAITNEEIKNSIPSELTFKLDGLQGRLSGLDKDIRQAIDQHGSYQDFDNGIYAVKQRRESITYQPMLVRRLLPENVASLVLVESVDTKKLDGLIKGGIVTQEQAKACGEVKETYAYIIK